MLSTCWPRVSRPSGSRRATTRHRFRTGTYSPAPARAPVRRRPWALGPGCRRRVPRCRRGRQHRGTIARVDDPVEAESQKSRYRRRELELPVEPHPSGQRHVARGDVEDVGDPEGRVVQVRLSSCLNACRMRRGSRVCMGACECCWVVGEAHPADDADRVLPAPRPWLVLEDETPPAPGCRGCISLSDSGPSGRRRHRQGAPSGRCREG